MESAKALNKQFSDLEKRLRGLSYVFKSKTSDSKDWRAAEAEMKGIKSETDSIIKKAQGKGYQWTKDSQSGDSRPLGVPVNFRISGIKDESGKTVNVPYAPPKAGAMDIPESKDNDDTPKPSKTESTAKPFQKKSDYSEDFEAITEKVGDLGVGPYKGKTIQDLMIEGYEVKPVTLGNGKKEWIFGKPDDTSRTGILMKSAENPPLVLSQWFSKRYGGNADDADALRHFAEALRWKIKQYNDFI